MHRGSATVAFECNGVDVDVEAGEGVSLLSVLREQLGITSVKDGCAPQGQCGCCTVLIDGAARVACVTPVARVAGRSVTTIEGLDAITRDTFAACFVATGGSQCGFCTPGIVMRAAALVEKSEGRLIACAEVDRAMAAHLCRCTGWRSVEDAVVAAAAALRSNEQPPASTGAASASPRAALEGGVGQAVGREIPLGAGGFSDDGAPRDALVAVPLPPGSSSASVSAADVEWVLGESLEAARASAGKVQGRRTTKVEQTPLPVPTDGAVRLATGWVEPAYLEPDASWCVPGGTPASPLANGGAFGGKVASPAPAAARELADRMGRTVRVVFAREDVVRLGPKRPPIAATATFSDGVLHLGGTIVGISPDGALVLPYRVDEIVERWEVCTVAGPPVSGTLRAFPLAERTVLAEAAFTEAGVDRAGLVADARAESVLLDTCARDPDGATAGARVLLDAVSGVLERVEIRVAAGDPLDETVLRSYCMGAAHMALGWVLSEGLAVDPETGEVLDLTIRSFGVIRAKDTPALDVVVVDDPGPALPRASDAVFAAVAAAAWNAVAAAEGARPESFPARETRAARRLRR